MTNREMRVIRVGPQIPFFSSSVSETGDFVSSDFFTLSTGGVVGGTVVITGWTVSFVCTAISSISSLGYT